MMTRALWLLGCAALGSWLAVMYLDDQPPYEYDVKGTTVTPDPAPQGALVTVNWALKGVHRNCPGTVQRSFRNLETGEVVSTLDTTPMSRSVRMGDRNLPRSFELPPNLPPIVGYSAQICAECNTLHRFFPLCFQTPEITIHVIPKEAK